MLQSEAAHAAVFSPVRHWVADRKQGGLQKTFQTPVEERGTEQNSLMRGDAGLKARVCLAVPRVCGSPDPPDQRPADGKNSLDFNLKPVPNGLRGTNLEVQKETTCVDVAAMAETPGTAPVSIGLAVDRLSLSSPSVQISIGSCLLLGCYKACN